MVDSVSCECSLRVVWRGESQTLMHHGSLAQPCTCTSRNGTSFFQSSRWYIWRWKDNESSPLLSEWRASSFFFVFVACPCPDCALFLSLKHTIIVDKKEQYSSQGQHFAPWPFSTHKCSNGWVNVDGTLALGQLDVLYVTFFKHKKRVTIRECPLTGPGYAGKTYDHPLARLRNLHHNGQLPNIQYVGPSVWLWGLDGWYVMDWRDPLLILPLLKPTVLGSSHHRNFLLRLVPCACSMAGLPYRVPFLLVWSSLSVRIFSFPDTHDTDNNKQTLLLSRHPAGLCTIVYGKRARIAKSHWKSKKHKHFFREKRPGAQLRLAQRRAPERRLDSIHFSSPHACPMNANRRCIISNGLVRVIARKHHVCSPVSSPSTHLPLEHHEHCSASICAILSAGNAHSATFDNIDVGSRSRFAAWHGPGTRSRDKLLPTWTTSSTVFGNTPSEHGKPGRCCTICRL